MIKKEYQKPALQVVKIQEHGIICTSPGAKSLKNDDGLKLSEDPLDEDDL